MRIGFDARTIEWTGVGTYSRNLLLQFSYLGQDVTVFCMDHTQDLIPASRRLRLIPTDAQPSVARHDAAMCALVEEAGVELLHVPCHLAPRGLGVPLVCTIHDVIPLIYPRSIRSPFARTGYRRRLLQVLADSAQIVTVSQISLSALSAYANVSLSKVRVIHNGVSEQFHPVIDREQLSAVRDSYRLPDRFAFWIGEFRPNKNLEFLLRSWGPLQQQLAEPLPLVLAGPLDAGFRSLKGIAAKQGLAHLVHFPGYIRSGELAAVYSAASVFVFPSLYEGFGLPPLEAMACGTPCVVSNSSSLPEVTGRAALMFNPTSSEQLADCVARVLQDPELAERLREEGLRQSARFSWRSAAEETLGVYESILRRD